MNNEELYDSEEQLGYKKTSLLVEHVAKVLFPPWEIDYNQPNLIREKLSRIGNYLIRIADPTYVLLTWKMDPGKLHSFEDRGNIETNKTIKIKDRVYGLLRPDILLLILSFLIGLYISGIIISNAPQIELIISNPNRALLLLLLLFFILWIFCQYWYWFRLFVTNTNNIWMWVSLLLFIIFSAAFIGFEEYLSWLKNSIYINSIDLPIIVYILVFLIPSLSFMFWLVFRLMIFVLWFFGHLLRNIFIILLPIGNYTIQELINIKIYSNETDYWTISQLSKSQLNYLEKWANSRAESINNSLLPLTIILGVISLGIVQTGIENSISIYAKFFQQQNLTLNEVIIMVINLFLFVLFSGILYYNWRHLIVLNSIKEISNITSLDKEISNSKSIDLSNKESPVRNNINNRPVVISLIVASLLIIINIRRGRYKSSNK